MKFVAHLCGREEVPPSRTCAYGVTNLCMTSHGQLNFRLVVNRICNTTVAHIHLGPKGKNGPVVVYLINPLKFGLSSRQYVVNGKLTSNDLVGPLKGKSIAVLLEEICRGNAYINVHSIQFPDGEIRGQLQPVSR